MSLYCFNLPFFIIGGQTVFVHCVSVVLFSCITSSCVLPIFQFLKLLFDHVSSLLMSLVCLPSSSSTIKVCSTHPLKRRHLTVNACTACRRAQTQRPPFSPPHFHGLPGSYLDRLSCSLPCTDSLSGAAYSLTSFIKRPPAALGFSTL